MTPVYRSILFLALLLPAFAQNTIDNTRTAVAKPWTHRAGSFPGTCTYGQILERTDQPVGFNMYECDGQTWVFMPRTSDSTLIPRAFQAKIGGIASATANSQAVIAVIGDSWVSGGNITDQMERVFAAKGYASAGPGYISLDPSLNPAPTGTTVSQSAGWLPYSGYGADLYTQYTVTSGSTLTFTATANSFVIHFLLQPGGGSFTWAVDGGSTTTVSTAGSSVGLGTATVSGLTTASHSLDITAASSGAPGLFFMGVDARLSANGIRVHKIGRAGAQASTIVGGVLDPIEWGATIAALSPDLVVIQFGTNEMAFSTDPAVMADNLSILVSRVKAAVPNADIVLAMPSDNGLVGAAYTMADYRKAVGALAAKLNVGFIDYFSLIGPYGPANTRGLYANPSHPNAVGGAVMAAYFARYLGL